MFKQQVYVSIVGSVVTGLVLMAISGSLNQALLGSFAAFCGTGLVFGLEKTVGLTNNTGRQVRGPKQ
jgi:hypothetical protein